jgi:predicted MFS family arabinose efflux permease
VSLSRFDLLRRARHHGGLMPLLLVFFLVSTAFSGFEATFALFTERRFDFNAERIGYVFAFIGLVLAVVNGILVGRVVPIVGERRLVPLAIAVIAMALLLLPAAQSVPALFAVCGAMAVGMGFNNPSLTSAVSRLSDPAEQGGMLGLAQSLAALGRIVGPAWGGFLFDRVDITTPYFSAGAVMSLALLLAVAGVRRADPGLLR